MLLDDLRSLVEKPVGCKVGQWVAVQEPEFQDLLDALAKKQGINYSSVLSTIQKYHSNLPFKRTSFVLHLKGECGCQAI